MQPSPCCPPGNPAGLRAAATCFPAARAAAGANLEWRTNTYAGLLLRRTLLKVYVNAGEYICLGSSAVGVGSGDAFIYAPGSVNGPVGGESFGSAVFQATTAQPGQGPITSRTQELAGPKAISGGGNPNGYAPASYQAPASGIYSVVFYGTDGGNSSNNGGVVSDVALANSGDFDTTQGSSVAAWDVTVRGDTDFHHRRNGPPVQRLPGPVHRRQPATHLPDRVRRHTGWLPVSH